MIRTDARRKPPKQRTEREVRSGKLLLSGALGTVLLLALPTGVADAPRAIVPLPDPVVVGASASRRLGALFSSARMLADLGRLTGIGAPGPFRTSGTAGEREAFAWLERIGATGERPRFRVPLASEAWRAEIAVTAGGVETEVAALALRFDSDGFAIDARPDPLVARGAVRVVPRLSDVAGLAELPRGGGSLRTTPAKTARAAFGRALARGGREIDVVPCGTPVTREALAGAGLVVVLPVAGYPTPSADPAPCDEAFSADEAAAVAGYGRGPGPLPVRLRRGARPARRRRARGGARSRRRLRPRRARLRGEPRLLPQPRPLGADEGRSPRAGRFRFASL